MREQVFDCREVPVVRRPVERAGPVVRVDCQVGTRPEQAALAHSADEALFQSKRAGRDAASVLVAGSPHSGAHSSAHSGAH